MPRSPRPLGTPLALLKAVRTTIRADSDPARVMLFASLTQSSRTVCVAAKIHAILGHSKASTLFVAAYGLRTLLTMRTVGASQPNVLTVAIHANAAHQVLRVTRWLPMMAIAAVRFDSAALIRLSSVGQGIRIFSQPRRVMLTLRVLHHINNRYSFLVSCRVAATMACYRRALELLRRTGAQAIVVSSDTNPEEVGVAAAARRLEVSTIYIAHAHPNAYTPALDYTLALLEGEAALEARAARGTVNGRVHMLGIEGHSIALNPRKLREAAPVVGIFAPKVVSWPTFVDTIAACRQCCGASRILIRWHPSMIDVKRLDKLLPDMTGIEVTPRSGSLLDIASQCDWAVSDANSNVHLQLLKLGVPTIAMASLGVHPRGHDDAYGFIANGVIPASVPTIDRQTLHRIESFYTTDWVQRFTRYDAAYLRDSELIERDARAVCEHAVRHGPKSAVDA